MNKSFIVIRFLWAVVAVSALSLLTAPQVSADMLTCAQIATDPAGGLAGNSSIKDVKAALVPMGAQDPNIPAPNFGRGGGPPGGGRGLQDGRGPQGGPPDGRGPQGGRGPAGGPGPQVGGGRGGRGPQAPHAAYCSAVFTYSARGDRKDGYAPGQMQHIKIAIGLPLNSMDGGTGGSVNGAWNGKLENLGGGGCAGNVAAPTAATDAGYVGSSTDTGHTTEENGSGQRCDFGVIQDSHELNKGMIDDFIYEGVHQQVEWSKTLAKSYYGIPAQRNYWNGCSTGGRQGLALAEKYGDEFDGFVIGAPAIYWQEFRLSDAWPAIVVKDRLTAKSKTLTAEQFAAATQAAVKVCDVSGLDTVQDGLIDDPRSCGFSARANICDVKGAPDAPNCLDGDQAAAIDEIWAGPTNEYGQRIWYPFDRGIALGGGRGGFGGFAAVPASTAQVMSYNHGDLTISTDLLFVDAAAIKTAGSPPGAMTYAQEAALGSKAVDDLMETQSVDLSKAKNHGAKIIMWQGAADPAIRWRDSLDYYRRVATYFGKGKADFAALQSWFRYYHAPGVGHCGGGEGPAPADIFGDLVNWVENGKAPDSILAKGGSLNPDRTRPLCPWPQTAVYKGAGSTDDAANFECKGNLDADPQAVCSMLHTQFGHETENALDDKPKGIKAAQCKPGKT